MLEIVMSPDYETGPHGNQPDGAFVSSQPAPATAAPAQVQRRTILQRAAIWGITLTLAAMSLAGAFGAGIIFERNVLASGQTSSEDPLTVFDVAWDTVKKNYVEEDAINEDQMLEGAIEGMLATLGDEGHTRYLTAEETKLDRQSSRGVYQGVGIQVREDEEDGLVVTRVFPDSPASEAGVQPADIVVGVNGEDIREMPIDAIIAMIRGPEGTSVEVTVYRPSSDEEITYDLERREIEVSAVTWEMLDNEIALLKLTQFSDRAGDDLAAALEEAKSEGADSIILDLRGNPGGLVREAMEVASLFVPDDAPVYISRTRDGGEEIHRADQGDVYIGDLPLVVLIDENTASASRIVSGSIKAEQEDATVIGETTVGTGTVLRRFELGDGSTIWLGVELWLTPDGRMIAGRASFRKSSCRSPTIRLHTCR
ncbi:MAG: S41 family peptidase [Thermomicrobiales bacterium]